MGNLSETVLQELNRGREQGRRTVGVLFQGNPAMVQQILAEGHNTIVLGERFRSLYSLYKQTQSAQPPTPLVVEARFDALPIRPGNLDALVLSQGLPTADLPRDRLVQLRALLKDSGLLVWPHPITNGVSVEEIRAIIHVISIYCGVPQGVECFRVARKVLQELDLI